MDLVPVEGQFTGTLLLLRNFYKNPDRVSFVDGTNDKVNEDWMDWFLWPSLD